MATNPSLHDVQVGDEFTSGLSTFAGRGWLYVSTVLAVSELSTRFNKPDRVLTVKTVSTSGTIIDHSKQIWWSQLNAGLV